MKKAICILCGIILLAAVCWTVYSGFQPRTDVYVDDFSLSGDTITFRVSIASSMGYTRGFEDQSSTHSPRLLKFYGTWGGFNSPLGAKSEFTLKLNPEDTVISFYRGHGEFVPVLTKDAAGEWHK